jgi:hypothetical protein
MSSKAAQCKKVIARLCDACGAGILAENQFCRQCGAPQIDETWTDEFSSQETVTLTTLNVMGDPFAYQTTLLRKDFYRAVSTPLIKAATESLTATKTERLPGPWSKGLIVALVLVPI